MPYQLTTLLHRVYTAETEKLKEIIIIFVYVCPDAAAGILFMCCT